MNRQLMPWEGEQHIENILTWLKNEVMSACGDGDAWWITRYHKLDDIQKIVERLNKEQWDDYWTVSRVDSKEFGEYISIANHQEWFIITNNEDYCIPNWAQCVLKW